MYYQIIKLRQFPNGQNSIVGMIHLPRKYMLYLRLPL